MFVTIRYVKINSTEIIVQKSALELTVALDMERGDIAHANQDRGGGYTRGRQQMQQHHIQDSLVHQIRLQQLVSGMGGKPTSDKLGLSLPSYPQPMGEMMINTMTRQEWDLKGVKEDMIVENAKVTCYLILMQKDQVPGGQFLNAVEPLALNMKDEQNMAGWIMTNQFAGMMTPMWPKIQSASASASSPTSSPSTTQFQ